jgi:hypothetical protein
MNNIGNVRRQHKLPEAPTGTFTALVLFCILFLLIPDSRLMAQSKEDSLINQITPESQFLDLIDLVEDSQKQLDLYDTFVTQFPKYEGIGTVHTQMQDLCLTLKLWDRALAIGDKLIKIDESDIAAVRSNLTAAEGKNDPALIARWRERLKQLEPSGGEVTAASTVRLPFIDEEPAGDLGALDLSTIPKSRG